MQHDQITPGSSPTLHHLVTQFIDTNEFESDPTWVVRWTLNQFARNDYDTFDQAKRQAAIDTPPPLTGHSGWDGFFAALAHYLSDRDQLDPPTWIDEDNRRNNGDIFYPGSNHREPDAMANWLALDPAPWFVDRGVGIVLRALPSGKGKHVPASL